MARTNKYTALNFNEIYEKKTTTTNNTTTNNNNNNNNNNHRRSSSFSSSSTSLTTPPGIGNKTILSNSRIHGNMLVLTLPSPKSVTPPSQPLSPASQQPIQPRIDDGTISLRPLGRTGSGPPLSSGGQNKNFLVSSKTNKFMPPHLRPGFFGQGLNYDGEERRHKSGGGYERMNDNVGINRSRSIGSTRPNSSG
ncbi:hypothetical protein L6452_15588 [Arctium lappa]|uniref:Uncharacterized protein n=1 Tax=Arctium lappa TaxID=4217 RepID=A0ACB9CPA5_ARCLA|nr:hypothetical protein L6452_15588 [Arctium lappa]